MTDNPHTIDFLTTAEAIARQAGALIQNSQGASQIERKGVIDLVTDVDRKAEALIVDALRETYPNHAINAEESGTHNSGEGYEWLVDPIDGTTNFAHGLPVYCISIALRRGAELVAGVVYDPSRDECFTATRGGGAFCNGKQLQVSQTAHLSDALLATGFPYAVRTHANNNLAEFGQFILRARGIRRLGAAALDLAYVAAGRFDGYWEWSINPWDIAAGMLLVHEAGGVTTDYTGSPASPDVPYIVASNGRIHDEMLAVLRDGDNAPLPAA